MNPSLIYPCFWYNQNAFEAASLYARLFPNSKAEKINEFLVTAQIDGKEIWMINAGSEFRPNPTLSLYTVCTSEEQINRAYAELRDGGNIIMPLDNYDWSEKYAWIEDPYGVSWQLTLGKKEDIGGRFAPAIMFVGERYGKAEDAMKFWMPIFPHSVERFIYRYPDGPDQGLIAHAQFDLMGNRIIVMDSGHPYDFSFNEGNSLAVMAENQLTIDYYWNKFTAEGEAGRCGWLKDKYGFSWQIVPDVLKSIMADPLKSGVAAQSFQSMDKLDLDTILNAIS